MSSSIPSSAALKRERPPSATAEALRQAIRSPRVVIGGAIVLAMVICAVFAPQIAPNDPAEQDLLNMLLPPMWAEGGSIDYPFGTDSLGRCILSQMIFGARVALFVGFVAAIGATLLGTTLALISGYFGGWIDRVISHLVDLWMSLPPVVLSVTLMVGFGTGVGNVILSIVLVDWTRFCRVVRSEVMVVARKDFVSAAKLLGFGNVRIILREILPSVAPLIITLFTLQVGIGIIVEAILSFVGLSVPAGVPAWGQMIAQARNYMYQAPWGIILPIIAMFITVLGFNLLGEGLRVTLDPRLRKRNI
ncbi:ABC transporter permease [Pseudorhodoplanes sp.]|uniref:ABC transporter permease n=1 Tax=Pseudorhodoplanes sp. TaxID=1934341 RepID=UPI002C9D5CAF|nr:ABC transporter permease [Pseudorhodoplanes sp.]HWV55684.1 ABC transporter permease [Pseudorhodoplanes sp.]